MKPAGGTISDVEPASLAARIGLQSGDRLVSINGQQVRDVLDYGFYIRESKVKLEVLESTTGETRWFEIEKEEDDDLGIHFADATFDGLRRCQNRCLFCFVDQMPSGMRPSLYAKDDDYRHSFWHGNFITLTNLDEGAFQRLLSLRLSPLYISVQATDPEVRQKLLRHRRAGEIMDRLRQLADSRIQLHTQIVCCPGLNDGVVLEKSLADLWSLGYSLASVSVVPVGLTSHRQGLFPLRTFQPDEAKKVIELMERWQQEALKERGETVFFAADEFYLLSGDDFPESERYEDYSQLENGVGLCRLFMEDWNGAVEEFLTEAKNKNSLSVGALSNGQTYLITGLSGGRFLSRLLDQTARDYGISWSEQAVQIVAVENRCFGSTVTVAGLVTGKDVIHTLRGLDNPPKKSDRILLPTVMFRSEGDVTLDDLTPENISAALGGATVELVKTSGDALFISLIKNEEP
ncbi:DUF512 domain-containing protein [Heliobacillus mobilis]|uniref:DUF512 domain-containing protein n=1 Tax=Heliobacterium mobile TaxID=28064 RepID=A0A6I3SBK9_HELMO|nr:DUF512 domain-containing protein [Heliobacterium mobile]MTV47493.1 DUF512 domain-containing protein [Heliobacterium mobile]